MEGRATFITLTSEPMVSEDEGQIYITNTSADLLYAREKHDSTDQRTHQSLQSRPVRPATGEKRVVCLLCLRAPPSSLLTPTGSSSSPSRFLSALLQQTELHTMQREDSQCLEEANEVRERRCKQMWKSFTQRHQVWKSKKVFVQNNWIKYIYLRSWG